MPRTAYADTSNHRQASTYGLVVSTSSDANVVPFNNADDVLHAALAVGMVGGGLVLGRRTVGRPAESV